MRISTLVSRKQLSGEALVEIDTALAEGVRTDRDAGGTVHLPSRPGLSDRIGAAINVSSRIALLGVTLLSACISNAVLSTPMHLNVPAVRGPAATPSFASHVGHHRSTPDVTVRVDPSQIGPAMKLGDLGSAMPVWYNFTLPGIARAVEAANLTITRFPGGAQADIYNWQTGADGPRGTRCAGNANPSSTFAALMEDIAIPANLRVAVTLNYGSNANCTGGADPSESAGLIAYAEKRGYKVAYATIGNEQYVPGAIDCRQPGCMSSRDPNQYSANEPAFYKAVKTASPSTKVCIDANLQNTKSKWNLTVFKDAKYDCIEVHYYPQRIITSDSFLLDDAVPQLTSDVNAIKGKLAEAGNANAPIYLGEISSAIGPYGKQSQSIVGALYAGMTIGEVEQDGLDAMTWHLSFGSCNAKDQGGDFRKDVYGDQSYGGAMIFSDGPSNNCPAPSAPNTLLATANAFLAASYFVHTGETMIGSSVTGSSEVRAYAGTYDGGYAFMLFNLNKSMTQDVAVDIAGEGKGRGGTVVTYDKLLYDESAKNVWARPSISSLGKWNNSIHLSLPPWSMVVVQTQ
jgi:hypothetical protein